MKRFIIIFFVGFFILISLAFFFKKKSYKSSTNKIPKTITAQNSQNQDEKNDFDSDLNEKFDLSFLKLQSGETYIDSILTDFDGDENEDRIIAVKKSANPCIAIIFSLYDSKSSTYKRAFVQQTSIFQTRTFSFYALDVTGNHKNSVVCQGIDENGNSSLSIFLAKKSGENFGIQKIADFKSNGTIYIQQLDREESYELSQAKGASFPIWISSTQEKNEKIEQVQTIYDWNEATQIYEQTSRSTVSQDAANKWKLSKIQDGTVETFSKFLDGLWYKTENVEKEIRYMYFDFKNREIVFLFGSNEEVYNWTTSVLRSGGIDIATVNSSIENLRRRFEILLLAPDSIRIRLQDDVRMLIKESNVWDGVYKKMSDPQKNSANKNPSKKFFELLQTKKIWTTFSGTIFEFGDGFFCVKNSSDFLNSDDFTNSTFTDSTNFASEQNSQSSPKISGFFSTLFVQNKEILQFKTQNEKLPSGMFLPNLKNENNENTIILTPIILTPQGFYKNESKASLELFAKE